MNQFRQYCEASFHFITINEKSKQELDVLKNYNNPYIRVNERGTDIIQSISSDFLIYINDFRNKNHICYLMQEDGNVAAIIPKSTSLVSQLHKHDYIEIVYVLEGSLEFVIEGERKRYGKNECCVINQNVRHVEGYNSEYMAIYLSIRSDYIKTLNIFKHSKGALESFLIRNTDYGSYYDYLDFYPTEKNDNTSALTSTETILYQIIVEMVEREIGFHDIVQGLIKRLIFHLESTDKYICNNTKYTASENDSLFEKTRRYLNSHRYKLTREELAQELNYNGNYISKVFFDHTGVSMAAYNREIYLQEAAFLLLNTKMSTSDIATKIGFENRTAFYTQFKNRYHSTPKQYRIQQHN